MIRKMARRQTGAVLRRGGSRQQVMREWEDEQDARNMYGITPPVSIWGDQDDPDLDDFESESNSNFMPRVSLLNSTNGLESLRKLVHGHEQEQSLMTVQEESPTSANFAMNKKGNRNGCETYASTTPSANSTRKPAARSKQKLDQNDSSYWQRRPEGYFAAVQTKRNNPRLPQDGYSTHSINIDSNEE